MAEIRMVDKGEKSSLEACMDDFVSEIDSKRRNACLEECR